MSQWHKIKWDTKDIAPGMEIKVFPHEDANGRTAKSTHPHIHPFHEMDWVSDAAKSEGAAHLHDGVTDHVRLVPEVRRVKAKVDDKIVDAASISVHAMWHDKDGNILRQDSVIHLQKEVL